MQHQQSASLRFDRGERHAAGQLRGQVSEITREDVRKRACTAGLSDDPGRYLDVSRPLTNRSAPDLAERLMFARRQRAIESDTYGYADRIEHEPGSCHLFIVATEARMQRCRARM
ncbi:hypothetical protein GCM10017602_01420 [Herbiconiux flava]|nr:hypothetical protein GCM10017602_01420 [Herbiconiux flava]